LNIYFDRDFLETPEGLLFCVVGCSHPRDRVIAYLKYAPSEDGKWGHNSRRFRRTMTVYSVPQVLNNVEMLRTELPQYVFRSRIMNILISAVPRRFIVRHYRPRERLSDLLTSQTRDALEEEVVDFVNKLSRDSGVDLRFFGVTGSILTRIHNASFSDMDITVYGLENNLKIKNTLLREYSKSDSDLKLPQGEKRDRMLRQWAQHYGLSPKEVQWFAERKWNRGIFKGRAFSLLSVHSLVEIKERYGDRAYYPVRIVEGVAKILDTKNSLFLPCTYGLKDVTIDVDNVPRIREIVSYDGFHSDIFQVDDTIRFRGKLEKVVEKGKHEIAWRILVGSPEAKGLDYIRPKVTENFSTVHPNR
jgi:predicted nucleotidyltransferase